MRCFVQIAEAGRSICRFIFFNINKLSKNHWVFQVFGISSSKATSLTPSTQGDYILFYLLVKSLYTPVHLQNRQGRRTLLLNQDILKSEYVGYWTLIYGVKCEHRITIWISGLIMDESLSQSESHSCMDLL